MIVRPAWLWMVTVGGLGHLRPASGTWGSLPPPVIAGGLMLAGVDLAWILLLMVGITLAASAACVAFGDHAIARFGRPDPGQVVADETAGQALTMLTLIWIDPAAVPQAWLVLPAALFFAFRLFDVLKPPPARQLERLPAGWGILCDDLAAGVMAGAAVWLGLLILLPGSVTG